MSNFKLFNLVSAIKHKREATFRDCNGREFSITYEKFIDMDFDNYYDDDVVIVITFSRCEYPYTTRKLEISENETRCRWDSWTLSQLEATLMDMGIACYRRLEEI